MTTKRKREPDATNSDAGGILDELGAFDRILRSRRRVGQRKIAGVWHDVAGGWHGLWDGIDGITDDEDEGSLSQLGESLRYIGTHIFLRKTWRGWPGQIDQLQSILRSALREEPITRTGVQFLLIFNMRDQILRLPFNAENDGEQRRALAVSVIHQLQDLHLNTGG